MRTTSLLSLCACVQVASTWEEEQTQRIVGKRDFARRVVRSEASHRSHSLLEGRVPLESPERLSERMCVWILPLRPSPRWEGLRGTRRAYGDTAWIRRALICQSDDLRHRRPQPRRPGGRWGVMGVGGAKSQRSACVLQVWHFQTSHLTLGGETTLLAHLAWIQSSSSSSSSIIRIFFLS